MSLCRYALTNGGDRHFVRLVEGSKFVQCPSLVRATKAVPRSRDVCGDNIEPTNSALWRRFPVVRASPMNGQAQTRAAEQVQNSPANVAASGVYDLRTLGNPYLRSNSLCQVGNRGHLSPKINKRKIIARK